MDIIITIPQTIKWEDYEKELEAVEDEKQVINFRTPNFPTQTNIGDRCFVVHKGFIRGWQKIVGFDEKQFRCSTTGKRWSGKFIQRSGKFFKIKPFQYKGFQGFRYFSGDSVV